MKMKQGYCNFDFMYITRKESLNTRSGE